MAITSGQLIQPQVRTINGCPFATPTAVYGHTRSDRVLIQVSHKALTNGHRTPGALLRWLKLAALAPGLSSVCDTGHVREGLGPAGLQVNRPYAAAFRIGFAGLQVYRSYTATLGIGPTRLKVD